MSSDINNLILCKKIVCDKKTDIVIDQNDKYYNEVSKIYKKIHNEDAGSNINITEFDEKLMFYSRYSDIFNDLIQIETTIYNSFDGKGYSAKWKEIQDIISGLLDVEINDSEESGLKYFRDIYKKSISGATKKYRDYIINGFNNAYLMTKYLKEWLGSNSDNINLNGFKNQFSLNDKVSDNSYKIKNKKLEDVEFYLLFDRFIKDDGKEFKSKYKGINTWARQNEFKKTTIIWDKKTPIQEFAEFLLSKKLSSKSVSQDEYIIPGVKLSTKTSRGVKTVVGDDAYDKIPNYLKKSDYTLWIGIIFALIIITIGIIIIVWFLGFIVALIVAIVGKNNGRLSKKTSVFKSGLYSWVFVFAYIK